MKIFKFEEIESWQEARKLTNIIYEITKIGNFSKDYGLKDQIQRASVSIMSNIAEGFDSHSNKHFTNFLNFSYRSASEVQSPAYVAIDQNYVAKERFDEIYLKSDKVKGLIGGFIKYLKQN